MAEFGAGFAGVGLLMVEGFSLVPAVALAFAVEAIALRRKPRV
jgi:hypothetical protein